MSQIAVLGMGAMGSRMATNLLKAGHALTVWNRSEEKVQPLAQQGATVAKTPRVAVEGADFVISMVRDDEASRAVWLGENGALACMGEGAIALESSTLTLQWTRELAAAFQSRNVAFLDAPVAGSLPQAEAAQLIYLVGGEEDIFSKTKPVLDCLGGALYYAGQSGNGMAIKLAVNTLFAVQAASLAELISFFQKCGLDADKATDILIATPVCSPAAKGLAGAMIARKFAPMFPIELVKKDLSYLVATAEENGALVPMSQQTQERFEAAIAQGKGADNITGIAQLYF